MRGGEIPRLRSEWTVRPVAWNDTSSVSSWNDDAPVLRSGYRQFVSGSEMTSKNDAPGHVNRFSHSERSGVKNLDLAARHHLRRDVQRVLHDPRLFATEYTSSVYAMDMTADGANRLQS